MEIKTYALFVFFFSTKIKKIIFVKIIKEKIANIELSLESIFKAFINSASLNGQVI